MFSQSDCWRQIVLVRVIAIFAIICTQGVVSGARADAVTLNFDDLGFGQAITGSVYAGLVWEQGNLAAGGLPGIWATPSLPSFSYPASLPHNLINAGGSTEIGIAFPTPVNFEGTYVAVQGNGAAAWAHRLRARGFRDGLEVTMTGWFEPITTTPAWFDLTALSDVDRVLFETPGAIDGLAYYGLDDLTFTYVPEPAGISLGLLGLGGLLLRRRRGAKSPKDK